MQWRIVACHARKQPWFELGPRTTRRDVQLEKDRLRRPLITVVALL